MKYKLITAVLIVLLGISFIVNINLYMKNEGVEKAVRQMYVENFTQFPLYDMKSIEGESFDVETYADSIMRMEKASAAGEIVCEYYNKGKTPEYDESFTALVKALEYTYKFDKDKLQAAFNDYKNKELTLKIAQDINDSESIKKLIELLDLDENYYNRVGGGD